MRYMIFLNAERLEWSVETVNGFCSGNYTITKLYIFDLEHFNVRTPAFNKNKVLSLRIAKNKVEEQQMRHSSHRETERKFLVEEEYHDMLIVSENGRQIRVYYFHTGAANPELRIASSTSVRLTIDDYGGIRPSVAKIAIKGPYTAGFEFTRPEFEWEIDMNMAEDMIKTLPHQSYTKVRCLHEHQGFTWEVDTVAVPDKGTIIVAEIEGKDEDKLKNIPLPPWISAENELRRFTWSDVIHKPLLDVWKGLYMYRMWR